MSDQNSIIAVDAEAAELDATRAVYDMLKPLRCEAQTRVLDHVYCLLRQVRQKEDEKSQSAPSTCAKRMNSATRLGEVCQT